MIKLLRPSMLLLPLVLAVASFGQQQEPPKQLTRQDYFKKSKNQKTAAWILTSAGAVGLVVTMSHEMGETLDETLTDIFSPQPVESESRSYAVPYIASAASLAGGVALFIASSNNRKKGRASSFHFKMDNALVLSSLSLKKLSYPSIAVSINF